MFYESESEKIFNESMLTDILWILMNKLTLDFKIISQIIDEQYTDKCFLHN